MRRSDEFPTFFQLPVENAIAKVGERLAEEVKRWPTSSLATENDEELATRIAKRFELEIPQLDFDAMTVERGTHMVPAEHFPKSFVVHPGKSYEKKTVIFRIPYRGDPAFLRCYDSTRSLSPARVFLDGTDVCFEVLSLSFDKNEIERERDAKL